MVQPAVKEVSRMIKMRFLTILRLPGRIKIRFVISPEVRSGRWMLAAFIGGL